jgi:hypothetical protein
MNNATSLKPLNINTGKLLSSAMSQRGKLFGLMIIAALLAFEVFNYSTTEFALSDVLGSLTFLGLHWSTILSIAFCGIDFAGVARLFTPEQGADEPAEVWYLFGAWILAAAMNATLTWWGVSIAIANHVSQGTSFIDGNVIQKVVPIFVAVMVWIIRILIIGTFSMAGERMLGQGDARQRKPVSQSQQNLPSRSDFNAQRTSNPAPQPLNNRNNLAPASNASFKPSHRPMVRTEPSYSRPAEPTYHNLASSQQAEQFEDLK